MEVRGGEVEEVEEVEEIEAKTIEDDRRANISQQELCPLQGRFKNPQLSLKINNLKTKRST